MFKKIDWKYYAMLFIGIVGLYSQFDKPSKSLSFEIVSQSSLQPKIENHSSELKLTFNGEELQDPTLTVLKLSNNGSKPILASDFTTPLELIAQKNVKLLRVNFLAKNPADLSPEIKISNNELIISPLLLNSSDSFAFEILASGSLEKLESKVRIVDIHSVPIEILSKSKTNTPLIILSGLYSFLCFIAGSFFMNNFPTKGVYLRTRAVGLVVFVCILTGTATFMFTLDAIGFNSIWWIFGFAVVTILISSPIASVINKSECKEENKA